MGGAVGQSLPVAVGVMVSPLPIVAVVLMLLSGNAKANAISFLVAWFATVAVVVAIVAELAGSADDDGPAAWTGWLEIVLGVLLLLLAVRQWRGRPRGGAEPATPAWMAAVDAFTPVKAAGLAVLLGGVNPKNLLLAVSGGAAIASVSGGDTGAAVSASLVFAAVASIGVAAPLVVYLSVGDRAGAILEELRAWLVEHNAPIMAVLLVVIGAKLLGDGIVVL